MAERYPQQGGDNRAENSEYIFYFNARMITKLLVVSIFRLDWDPSCGYSRGCVVGWTFLFSSKSQAGLLPLAPL